MPSVTGSVAAQSAQPLSAHPSVTGDALVDISIDGAGVKDTVVTTSDPGNATEVL